MELALIFAAVFAATLVCLLVKNRTAIEYASVAAAILAFAASVVIAIKVSASGTYVPTGLFSIDALGAIIALIIGIVSLAVSFYSVSYLRRETEKGIVGLGRVRQFFILLNLFIGAMFLAVASSNPILTWISIEATTLSTAFLISFYDKPSSMEAAWKYLIINSIGLLLGFFGTILYFTPLGTGAAAGLTTWNVLLRSAALLDPTVAKIAFVFVLIGYGTKVGLAPMHTWLPDAHSKAPVPVSALLSGVLLNVALIAVLRFRAVTDLAVGPEFSRGLLIAFGILSVFVAVFMILGQKNYKRLLAYSSIENMGLMSLGFGFGGIGAFGAILHMIYHSLVKSALFLAAGTIFLRYSSTKIEKVKGALTALPVTGVLFLIGFFAITGTPPFGIFLTKIMILSAGVKAHPLIVVLILALTAVLFVGFFGHVVAMMFGEKTRAADEVATPGGERGGAWLIAPPLALLAVALALSFYIPPFLERLVAVVASNY